MKYLLLLALLLVSCNSPKIIPQKPLPAMASELAESTNRIDSQATDIRVSVASGRRKAPEVEPEWTDIDMAAFTIKKESSEIAALTETIRQHASVMDLMTAELEKSQEQIRALKEGQQRWLYRFLYGTSALTLLAGIFFAWSRNLTMAGMALSMSVGSVVFIRFMEAYLDIIVKVCGGMFLLACVYGLFLLIKYRLGLKDIIKTAQKAKNAAGEYIPAVKACLKEQKPSTQKLVREIKKS